MCIIVYPRQLRQLLFEYGQVCWDRHKVGQAFSIHYGLRLLRLVPAFVSLMTEPGTRDNWGEPATKARSQPITIPILASLSYTIIILHPSKQAPCRDIVLYSLHLLKWLEVSLFRTVERYPSFGVVKVPSLWEMFWMFDFEGICFLTLAGQESAVDLLLSKPPYSRRSKLVGRERLRTAANGWPKSVQAESSTSPEYSFQFIWFIYFLQQYMTIHIILALFGQAGAYGRSCFLAGSVLVQSCWIKESRNCQHLSTSVNICQLDVQQRLWQGNKDVQEDRWPGRVWVLHVREPVSGCFLHWLGKHYVWP